MIDKGYQLLQSLLKSDEKTTPELDYKIVKLLELISSKRQGLNSDDIKNVLDICKKNNQITGEDAKGNDISLASAKYLKHELDKGEANDHWDNFNVYEIIDAFGKENMDKQVFLDLENVVEKVFRDGDVEKAVDGLNQEKDLDTNFVILAHFADNPKVKE